MDGGVPRGDGPDLLRQRPDDRQLKELSAVFLRQDRVVSEYRDLAGGRVAYSKKRLTVLHWKKV